MALPLIQLSQSHLQTLSTCPRRYQHTYIDQLLIPDIVTRPKQDEELGQQFHLLMQQHWLGLDVAPVLAASPQLKQRFEAFQQRPPKLIAGDRLTEYRRMLKLGHYLLVSVFDLLTLNSEAAQIVDWKSYRKPKSSDRLRKSWQTKLYLFILAETSALNFANISMTYWFASTHTPQESPTYTFQYSEEQHRQTHQQLLTLLGNLDRWRYQLEEGHDFPSGDHSKDDGRVDQCPCQRFSQPPQIESLIDFDAMPDLPLPSSP